MKKILIVLFLCCFKFIHAQDIHLNWSIGSLGYSIGTGTDTDITLEIGKFYLSLDELPEINIGITLFDSSVLSNTDIDKKLFI